MVCKRLSQQDSRFNALECSPVTSILCILCVCTFVPVQLTQCNVIDRTSSIHRLIIDEYRERWELSPVTVQLKHAREGRWLNLWLYIVRHIAVVVLRNK